MGPAIKGHTSAAASITFGEIAGKLAMLRLECRKCGRRGQYRVDKLLREWGPDGSVLEWSAKIMGSCTKRMVRNPHDPCPASCPDIVRIFREREMARRR